MKALVPIGIKMAAALVISALAGSLFCANANINEHTLVPELSAQTPPQSKDNAYKNYGVRSAATTSTDSIKPTKRTSEGYFIKSADGKDIDQTVIPEQNTSIEKRGYNIKMAPQEQDIVRGTILQSPGADKYQRRRAPENGRKSTLTQSESTSRNDAAYSIQSVSVGKDFGESYAGYAVKSAGSHTSRGTESHRFSSRNDLYSSLYEGTKFYDRRGHRMSLGASQVNRTVIIMPVIGKAITGVVIKDDPGRSIVVEMATGGQASFEYGEIDALVNI